jgi:hypothetical protein
LEPIIYSFLRHPGEAQLPSSVTASAVANCVAESPPLNGSIPLQSKTPISSQLMNCVVGVLRKSYGQYT